MTIQAQPTTASTMIGGTVDLPESACSHEPARFVTPWTGEPGTSGTVTVVGAGKMGLPLAAQFASPRLEVIAVDIDPSRSWRQSTTAGPTWPRSRAWPSCVAAAHTAGRLRATTDGGVAARDSDVVILIVPVILDALRSIRSTASWMPRSRRSRRGHRGPTVVFETTLPVGDTRDRFLPMFEAATGLTPSADLFVAFSPERLYSGAVFRNLATYPKLVGGIGPASTDRASRFLRRSSTPMSSR